MICEGCGYSAPALKSVRWRNGGSDRRFALCDRCYAPLAASVWIVRGRLPVWGQCRSCSAWRSMNDLREVVGGGRWDSFVGTCRLCQTCTEEEE